MKPLDAASPGMATGRADIGFPLANYGLNYWLPTVVKGFGVSNTVHGLLAIIPGIVTAWALWWVPHHSARTGETTWHIVIPAALGAVSLALSVVVPSNPVRFALLCVAAACVLAPSLPCMTPAA